MLKIVDMVRVGDNYQIFNPKEKINEISNFYNS